jgi:hypothetical protein
MRLRRRGGAASADRQDRHSTEREFRNGWRDHAQASVQDGARRRRVEGPRRRYNSGRINEWVKVTCRQRETLPIAGFALKDSIFDGLYIGRLQGNNLIYAGKIDHGFDKVSTKRLAGAAEAADS